MSRKAPQKEEIVHIRRLLKLRVAQQSIPREALLWEKEFWSSYIWLSKELSNTEKWLASVLYFLGRKGTMPVCVEQEWVKLRYMHEKVSIGMHFRSLAKKGYIKKLNKWTYYFPNFLVELPPPDPWGIPEWTYRELGLWGFFLHTFHDRIKLNRYIKPSTIDQKISEFASVSLSRARSLYLHLFKKLEGYGLVQRQYFFKKRKFRLVFLQPFPVSGLELPDPQGLTLPEYGLLIDIFLHKLRDDSIYTPCMPERKVDPKTRKSLLKSLCQKERLRQITRKTFLFIR